MGQMLSKKVGIVKSNNTNGAKSQTANLQQVAAEGPVPSGRQPLSPKTLDH
jgi:hypothetical protein